MEIRLCIWELEMFLLDCGYKKKKKKWDDNFFEGK